MVLSAPRRAGDRPRLRRRRAPASGRPAGLPADLTPERARRACARRIDERGPSTSSGRRSCGCRPCRSGATARLRAAPVRAARLRRRDAGRLAGHARRLLPHLRRSPTRAPSAMGEGAQLRRRLGAVATSRSSTSRCCRRATTCRSAASSATCRAAPPTTCSGSAAISSAPRRRCAWSAPVRRSLIGLERRRPRHAATPSSGCSSLLVAWGATPAGIKARRRGSRRRRRARTRRSAGGSALVHRARGPPRRLGHPRAAVGRRLAPARRPRRRAERAGRRSVAEAEACEQRRAGAAHPRGPRRASPRRT